MPFRNMFNRAHPAASSRCAGTKFASDKLTLKYFNLGNMGGRGGVVRFMLYIHDIKFEDVEIIPDDSWMTLKEELVSSGHNPCGGLPVLYINDKPYFDHVAILEYIASKLNVAPTDPEVKYGHNVVMFEYAAWRSDWAACLFDEDKKKTFIAERRDKFYALMEKLYGMRQNKAVPYFMGKELPGHDDLCMFMMIFDDRQACGEFALDKYPTLGSLYEKIGKIPKIEEWCKKASETVK